MGYINKHAKKLSFCLYATNIAKLRVLSIAKLRVLSTNKLAYRSLRYSTMILMNITSSLMYWWSFKLSRGMFMNNGEQKAIFISDVGRWKDEFWGSEWNTSILWSPLPWSNNITVNFFCIGQVWRASYSPLITTKNNDKWVPFPKSSPFIYILAHILDPNSLV